MTFSLSYLIAFLSSLPKLGLANVFTVLVYRLAILLKLVERMTPIGKGYRDSLFVECPTPDKQHQQSDSEVFIVREADKLINGNIQLFSSRFFNLGSPPNWFLNPINEKCFHDTHLHWSRICDFESGVGDIKCVWESSRFTWAPKLAMAYRFSGRRKYLETLNQWVSDWTWKNPLNCGPNWKCGQESSIRMLNLTLTAFLLRQDQSPTDALIRFVKEHCERIEPTIRYAIAQDNNHGTSEAAALFVGGGWLKDHTANNRRLKKKALQWERKGRFWLENRVAQLIESDGSFSQYSVNYHRLVLDTLSLVTFWQRRLGLREFPKSFYQKAQAAAYWLFQIVDPLSGDAPNLGSNDGATLFSLTTCDYRDFRPSVQLGAVLFSQGRAYREGPWDEILNLFDLHGIEGFACDLVRRSENFEEGGYVILQGEDSWGMVRIPNYRFRPGHADALHFDLWHKGRNILRDGGSYSYNCTEPWQSYFPGTKSHNTIEFDGRDQMPRISRFLWGSWTKGETIQPLSENGGSVSWSGAYTDYNDCRHQRTISVHENRWQVSDVISGFKEKAHLRWRLEPGQWKLEDNLCRGEDICIEIKSDDAALDLRLTEGWESRYYMEKTKLPVLEALVKAKPAKITTLIRLSEN